MGRLEKSHAVQNVEERSNKLDPSTNWHNEKENTDISSNVMMSIEITRMG
jgi:hypothetical protein